jgi:hypothetical protein
MRVKTGMTILAVSLLCSVGAFAQQPLMPRDFQQIDVATEYASLRTRTSPEIREAYQAMPSATRRAIWTEHLVTFLREHPEFDAAQRAVILEGIGLLATGIFDVAPYDLIGRELAGKEIERVVAKAKELLPKELVWSAFYSLNRSPERGSSSNLPRNKRLQTNTVDCDCSHYLGCEDPNATCVPRPGPGFCVIVPSYDCGPYFYYACDGLCQYL